MKTYCNPLDLGYRYQHMKEGERAAGFREGADPTLVYFKGKYYLFVSMSAGFWYSDDLLHWDFHADPDLLIYDYAPDVRQVGDYLYFSASRKGRNCPILRTADPLTEPFTEVSAPFAFWDPDMFCDDDGRVYFYWGCSNTSPIWGVELDPDTMTPIGEKKELIFGREEELGYERPGNNGIVDKEASVLYKAMKPFYNEATGKLELPPQMAQMPVNTRPRRLARKILTSYFDEFVKKHYEKLMARLQISEDDFRDAIAEIRHLSPKPGNLYAEGGTDTTPYIIPDFILDYQDGRLNLSLNSYNVPEVRVNRRYMEMIREMVGSDGRVREKDKEAIQFVKNKIDSAKWFISAIKQRHDTLMRTMQTILDYQQEYFKDGDKSKLRPMILKDIADRTGLDVSTISRVVNSKYVQTQFGIILLKSLFSEAMQTDSGEEVSSYEIKNILQQCIDEEDKRRPLTDETLMDILNSKGYRIARRTVAKYREMLGIPVARLRKQI